MNAMIEPVAAPHLDQFYARFDAYRRELDGYDPRGPDRLPLDRYRDAHSEDGCDRWWLLSDRERAGFAIVRVVPDWPDGSRLVAEIIDLGIDPAWRRQGIGRAGVEALCAYYRPRVASIEAAILADNAPALAFWSVLGFAPRSIQTAREP